MRRRIEELAGRRKRIEERKKILEDKKKELEDEGKLDRWESVLSVPIEFGSDLFQAVASWSKAI